LTNFRILLLPVFLLLLLSGCAQSLYNRPAASDGNYVAPESDASPISPNEQEAPVNNQPAPSVSAPAENNMKVSNSIATKTDESETADPLTKIQPVLDEALDFCRVSQELWQKGELENALEALDQAYSLILKVDTLDDPKLIQEKEDLRFMISKRILEIYASRNIVVSGNHRAIPMVMNKHIQAEMDRFTKGNERQFFIDSYKRSGRYRPMMVAALKEAGLPTELSWLPLIESGFKVKALSRARALGLWQFIPSTGYKFGLKRDKYIDERIDPVKSTQAAIAYLKELHQIFGDWTTVLAGYNCGEGQVLRVIRSQNINYLDNFWDLYERLPQETARYVPRFMATLHIVKDLKKYDLDSLTVDSPWEYDVVSVAKQVHLRNVAKAIGSTEKELRNLNPELRYRILPQEKYPLRVPPGKGKKLLAKVDKIPISHPPQRAYIYHRVRPGQSLSTIAQRYRTSVRSIARANNIRRRDFIVAGQKLKIPRKGTVVYRSKKYDKPIYERPSAHVVKSGDSLWIIAKRYGTTTKKIQELNNLATTHLSIGQVLRIPGAKDLSPAGETLKTCQVKRGDSPFQIAQRHNMPLERFLQINRLTPRSKIFPGQRLYVE
jgi:membrane-bound lytic murein transglycosylase D